MKKDSSELMEINEKKNLSIGKEKDKEKEKEEKNLFTRMENKNENENEFGIEIENKALLNSNKNCSFLLNPINPNFPSTIFFKNQEDKNSKLNSKSKSNSNSNLDLLYDKREISEIIWEESLIENITKTDQKLLSKIK